MKRILDWLLSKLPQRFANRESDEGHEPVGVRVRSVENSETEHSAEMEFDSKVPGRIESDGPGKNVFVPNEDFDSETVPEIEILDEAALKASREAGVDPYDTGCFDTSKSWGRGVRK